MNGAIALPLDLKDLDYTSSEGSLIRRTILDNGVRILTEKVVGARSASIGLWVPVGSRDELHGHYGSTHFLEHLLFKGTTGRSALDIAISFDAVGGEHNALTAKEHTCYYAKVRDQDLPMAIDVLFDMITSSVIDPEEFEVERGVILEELAMADDDPANVVNERLFESVLGGHPLARPIGGSQESIRAVSRSAVWEHYKENYGPRDLVVTVAGALHHEEVVAMVEQGIAGTSWAGAPSATPEERRSIEPAGAIETSPLSLIQRPIEQVNLVIGMPGITATDERRSVMAVLNSVLGGGMSSRLFQEVRECRGLAYSVYSFSASYSDTGVFGLYAGCSPLKTNEVADLMLEELARLAADGISGAELRRAFGQLSGASALALEDSDTRMARLGAAEITMGEFSDLDESLRRLGEVTTEAVAELAAELAGAPLSFAVVGSLKESDLKLQSRASAA